MGILYNGILGGFVNKTGPLIGRKVGKKNVVSALPHKSELPATMAQVIQRQRFKTLHSCLLDFNLLISIGFRDLLSGKRLGAAFAVNYPTAIGGDYPGFQINYDQLVLSRGKLQVLNTVVVVYRPDLQTLVFSWQPDLQNRLNRATDFVCISVYEAGLRAVTNSMFEARRSDLSCTIPLHQDFTAGGLHCFITVASADNRDVSNSRYLNL